MVQSQVPQTWQLHSVQKAALLPWRLKDPRQIAQVTKYLAHTRLALVVAGGGEA